MFIIKHMKLNVDGTSKLPIRREKLSLRKPSYRQKADPSWVCFTTTAMALSDGSICVVSFEMSDLVLYS